MSLTRAKLPCMLGDLLDDWLTKLARDIIADNDRLYASQQSDLDGED